MADVVQDNLTDLTFAARSLETGRSLISLSVASSFCLFKKTQIHIVSKITFSSLLCREKSDQIYLESNPNRLKKDVAFLTSVLFLLFFCPFYINPIYIHLFMYSAHTVYHSLFFHFRSDASEYHSYIAPSMWTLCWQRMTQVVFFSHIYVCVGACVISRPVNMICAKEPCVLSVFVCENTVLFVCKGYGCIYVCVCAYVSE